MIAIGFDPLLIRRRLGRKMWGPVSKLGDDTFVYDEVSDPYRRIIGAR